MIIDRIKGFYVVLSPLEKTNVGRIHELDGLRGLLALYVAATHLALPLRAFLAELDRWGPILRQGWYAVDVFFIMSGVVMMHVYAQVFAKGTRPQAMRKFYLARVARLYPVHIVTLMALVIIVVPLRIGNVDLFGAEGRFSASAAIASLVMMHGPWIDHQTWNYPSWSISAEWHAYFLFPFLVGVFCRCRGPLILMAIAIGTLIPFVLYIGDFAIERYPTNGTLLLLRVLPLFMVGMAIFRIRALYSSYFVHDLWVGTIIVGTLMSLSSPASAPVAVLLAPFVVIGALGNPRFSSFLRIRAFLFLGTISYSLYMTHTLVDIFAIGGFLKSIRYIWGVDLAENAVASLFIWLNALIGSIAVGAVTWQWIETPGRHALRL